MIVYHGSYAEITKIDLSMAKDGTDFGKGFYVTSVRRDAERMAAEQGDKYGRIGIVSIFEFDYEEAFSSGRYKTKIFENYTREWLDFVVKNRDKNTKRPAHEYDIVEGPIADDAVNEKLQKYLRGRITAEKFLEKLEFSGSHQICFCTEKALNTIERTNLIPHDMVGDIGNAIINYLKTDKKLSERNARGLYYKSDTYKNLADESTNLYQKPWQEVYNILMDEIGRKQAPNFSMKQFVVNGHVYYGSDLSADEVYMQEELQKERRQGPDTPESGGGDFGL